MSANKKFTLKDILLFAIAVALGFVLLVKVLPIVFKFIFWIAIAAIIIYIARHLYLGSS